jgi:hypothetical protein
MDNEIVKRVLLIVALRISIANEIDKLENNFFLNLLFPKQTKNEINKLRDMEERYYKEGMQLGADL